MYIYIYCSNKVSHPMKVHPRIELRKLEALASAWSAPAGGPPKRCGK